jgi:nicotinamide-nucleotide amidase
MEYLMENSVIPYLRRRFGLESRIIQYRVLRACGLGESAIGLQIKDLMKQNQNPSVGTLASIGDIKIRITANAADPHEASSLISAMEARIRERLGTLIYGVDDETLHGNIAREMERLNLTLSVVETFTGGIVSHKLSGTGSNFFIQGLVLPAERSRVGFLKISEDEFRKLQADPQTLTDRLSVRAREEYNTTFGLAVHGHATEDQGKGEYRMETFYSISSDEGIERQPYSLGGELWTVRERASIIALDLLRKYLMKKS